jgi:hypothetical protein
VTLLRTSLVRSLKQDLGSIDYVMGETCWKLALPRCALSHLYQAEQAGRSTVDAEKARRQYENALREPLYQYHYEYARRLENSTWSYRFLGDAACNANAAYTYANNEIEQSSSKVLLGSIYARRGQRGRACRAYRAAEWPDNIPQHAQAIKGEKRLGCTDYDYSFFGDPFDSMQQDKTDCDPLGDPHNEGPDSAGLLNPLLYANAILALSSDNRREALHDLIRVRQQAEFTLQSLQEDFPKVQLATADADVLAGNKEAAVQLYRQWLQQGFRYSTPSSLANQVGATLAVLDASLAYEHYSNAIAAQSGGNWAKALEEFGRADSYWQHPEDELGIAISELHLYKGCTMFQIGPSELVLAYDAFKQYLDRAPNAPDRAQVEATMNTVKAREQYCSSGQYFTDEIALFFGAQLLNYLNSVSRTLQASIQSSGPDSLWNGGGGITVEWGGSGTSYPAPSGPGAIPQGNPDRTPGAPPSAAAGAGPAIVWSGPASLSFNVSNVVSNPIVLPMIAQSSIAGPGGTVIGTTPVHGELGIAVSLPPSLINQASWSWAKPSYTLCEGIGVHGSYRVFADASAEPIAGGGKRITHLAVWVASPSFTQATAVVDVQVEVIEGSSVRQRVNLVRPDVPSIEAPTGDDESRRLYLPDGVELAIPVGAHLHVSTSVSLRQPEGACPSSTSEVDIDPTTGDVH